MSRIHLIHQMVESRMLYVLTKEKCCCTQYFALYEKAMCNIHPLCSPRSTPTWPFDVKPPTYEPIGLIPTRESSVLFEIILHQALKQTGETTRACRFCLQVLNFLQMEGRSAFYRKFLRISDIRELWAATRILSRGSMSASSYLYVRA